VTVATLPDAEALVIGALLSQEPITDAFGDRLYSMIPKTRTFPLVRVMRYGGDPLYASSPYWLDGPAMQIDVWADGRAEALRLGELVRATLAQTLVGAWPLGVVSSCVVSALVNNDDATLDPPKPRYRFSATLIVHPTKQTGAEVVASTPDHEGRLSPARKGQ